MKPLQFLTLTIGMTITAWAEEAIPGAFPNERYHETLVESPFALESVKPAPPSQPVASPKLVLTGLGKLNDGRTIAFVQREGDARSMALFSDMPNAEGISIKAVHWGSDWKRSSAVIRDGSEEREIRFSEKPPAVPPPKSTAPGKESDRDPRRRARR